MSALTEADPILSWIREQEEALARLRHAIRVDKVAQSYLFHGPRGVGKTRTAIGFAQALNCTALDPPCGSCLACRKIARLTHPDVRLLVPTTREEDTHGEEIVKRLEEYGADRYHRLECARNASIGIDAIRGLKSEAALSMVEGRRRVFILADAHRMHEDAAQSALKLIEEPPAGTHLILTVEEPTALLPTIVSRCQQVRFTPLSHETIRDVLASVGDGGDEEISLIAALSEGSMGRALTLMEEESIVETRDAALELLDVSDDPSQIQEKVTAWARKLDPNRIRWNVELLLMWYHDLLTVKYDVGTDTVANRDRLAKLRKEASRMSLAEIRVGIDALEEWLEAVSRNVNPHLALHNLLHAVAHAKATAQTQKR